MSDTSLIPRADALSYFYDSEEASERTDSSVCTTRW